MSLVKGTVDEQSKLITGFCEKCDREFYLRVYGAEMNRSNDYLLEKSRRLHNEAFKHETKLPTKRKPKNEISNQR